MSPDDVKQKTAQVFLSLDACIEVCIVDGHLSPNEIWVYDFFIFIVKGSFQSFSQELHDSENLSVVRVYDRC